MVGKPSDFTVLESGLRCSGQIAQQRHTSVALWGMDTVATRQKDRDSLSVLSLTLLSWMNPAKRKQHEDRVVFFRGWRANTRERFNDLGHSVCGPAQVERWLTFAERVARMEDSRVVKKVLRFRPLLEGRTRQDLVGARGGGGNPLRHRGQGVRHCVWEKAPEQVSRMWQAEDQKPQRSSWTELASTRESWHDAGKQK